MASVESEKWKCTVSKYYLSMTRKGELCRSGNFLNPTPGLYQVISDVMFSAIINPKKTPCSSIDHDVFFLCMGAEKVAKFSFKDARYQPASDVPRNGLFHVTSEDGNYTMTFSAIQEHDDSNEYYICCPRFEHN